MKPLVLLLAVSLCVAVCAASSHAVQSDDFSSPSLNTSLWRFYDPAGDVNYSLTGTNLLIEVPAGASHDLWGSANRAPRFLQPAADEDFGVEVKFDSDVTTRYQMQGIIVQESDGKLLRFDVFSDGAPYVFAAYLNNGSSQVRVYQRVPEAPSHLRVTRAGNSWTFEYSSDGSSWQTAGSFSQAINVTEAGFFAANHGFSAATTPGHTGDVDYFFNTASPIVPEDGGGGGVTYYTLDVNTVGGGSVSRVPSQASYAEGSDVELTAVADPGWSFAGWSGDLSGSANPATLTMSDDAQVTATFTQNSYTLSINAVGGGSVNVSPNQATYTYGQVVQLAAVPDAGNFFQGWSGDAGGSANPTNITITDNANVTATFGQTTTYTLDVSVSGNGSVTRSPDQGAYTAGQNVTLTAFPDPGWTFDGWSGDAGGSANPIVVTMDGNKSVSASFSPVVIPSSIVSDDFNSPNLDTSLWRFEDPSGIANLVMTGTNVLVDVPGGADFDLWTACYCAPRLMQPANDEDFSIELKFDSEVEERFQKQGFLIAGNANDFMRVDVYHSGQSVFLFAGYATVGGSGATRINTSIGSMPSYLRLERSGNQWTYRYSYNGSSWQTAGTFTQNITVTDVGFFVGGDDDAAMTGNVDYFFNTASPVAPEDGGQQTAATPPVVDVWYGDNQVFGEEGNPQTLIQVMGRVWDTDDITSLSYRLNGGSSNALNMGPDGLRLERRGEFNLEIDNSDLSPGANSVQITATDDNGEQTVRNVTVNYTAGVTATLPRVLTWQGAASVPDVAQVVDGLWHIEGDGVRTSPGAAGYDRLLVTGEHTWAPNYEVVMPVTVHSMQSGGAVGVALGWTGHTGPQQPKIGPPYQSIGWVTSTSNLQLLRINDQLSGQVGVPFNIGTRYILKMRSQAVGGGTSEVKVKWWQDGTSEPGSWDIESTANTRNGSVLLIVHRADATIGETVITPLAGVPEYTLTTNTTGNGSITRSPNQSTYTSGSSVQLTAVPDPGWSFAGWSGDLSGSANPATITMTSNATVTATFAQDPPPAYTLTVNTNGNGSVTRDPNQPNYTDGTQVELTAVADPGWSFAGWSGGLSGSANPATVTMTANTTVTATFTEDAAPTYTLSVTSNGDGTVSRDPDQPDYAEGSSVELTATPNAGSYFVGWSGDLSGAQNPVSVSVNSNMNITADFAPLTASSVQSDDFAGQTLDTSLWRFLDPVGDVNYSMTGTNLEIDVPGGGSHDLYGNNKKAPRFLQSTLDEDFGVEIKFDSQVVTRYQMQGLVVQESDDKLIRFDVYNAGSSTTSFVFAAFINGGSSSVRINRPVAGTPSYLRLTRTGNSWHCQYSYDGSTWTTAGTFNQAMTVAEVGFFAANHGFSAAQTPAFTGSVDHFFNVDDPIVPQDGPAAIAPPVTVAGDTPPSVRELTLRQNFPNPFKSSTSIEYGLPEGGDVTVRVFDVRGRRVYEERIASAPAGWNRFNFDGRGFTGAELPAGVYFYKITTPQGTLSKKMVIAR